MVGDVAVSPGGGLAAHVVVRRPGFDLDVEVAIEPGTTAALLGPNGAGKSTVVAVLAGTLDDDGAELAGTHVELDGRVLDDVGPGTGGAGSRRRGVRVAAADRRIGVVFQQRLLFDHLSVLDNVAFGPRSRGADRRSSREVARRWLDRLDLAALAEARPPSLSGGQAQRVAIARALAADGDLLLLDEPMAALDVESRTGVRRLLRRHLDDVAAPRLLITHDPADALLLADRVHVVQDGRVTQVGTPDEIRRRPATPWIATLAETNLFAGSASRGAVELEGSGHRLTVADRSIEGRVTAVIHPRAVSLHAARPEGSQRNVWEAVVELVEPLGDVTRVTLGSPLPLAVDITPASTEALAIRPGTRVWAAVKATEVIVTADGPPSPPGPPGAPQAS